ncbi:MAG: flagellar assembly protein FliW [Angelakisella sp.]
MMIETRNFGPMEIDTEQVVHFKQTLYGFEEQRDFVVLSDSNIGDCFLWLQSITSKEVCFILVVPAALPERYDPLLPGEMATLLEIDDPLDVIVRLVAVIPEKFTESTVNLKSPIIINTVRRCAAQVMLEEDYPVRAPLVAVK